MSAGKMPEVAELIHELEAESSVTYNNELYSRAAQAMRALVAETESLQQKVYALESSEKALRARLSTKELLVQSLQREPLTDARIIEIRQKTNANGDFSPFSDTKAFARAIEAECSAARAATKGGAA